VIADFRAHNLSSQVTNGLDFGASYQGKIGTISTETGLDGTRIFQFKNRFTPAAQYVDILNTPYNPIDLRVRAREIVKEGAFTAAFFVNYIVSYSNNTIVGPPAHVSSWTTVDATVSYRLGKNSGLLSDLALTFGVLNLANRAPPYVANEGGYASINYDGANANALGRFVFLQLAKRY
jgi:outer membrane receptor protein involved in Fe transport